MKDGVALAESDVLDYVHTPLRDLPLPEPCIQCAWALLQDAGSLPHHLPRREVPFPIRDRDPSRLHRSHKEFA